MKKLEINSPFKKPRGSYPLDMVVIHHIGSQNKKLYSVGGTITWFTNVDVHKDPKTGKITNIVSAHYVLPREPYKEHDLVQLVSHADIAYHAGRSSWEVKGKKRTGINKYSIGIELEGDGNLLEYTPFQYSILTELIKNIKEHHSVADSCIVGHEHISPGRKVDPGKYFDWDKLRHDISKTVVTMPSIIVTPDPEIESLKDEKFHMDPGTDVIDEDGIKGVLLRLLDLVKSMLGLN